MIVAPPVIAGCFHVNVTLLFPVVAFNSAGAPGTENGIVVTTREMCGPELVIGVTRKK